MGKAPPPESEAFGFVLGHAYDTDDPEFVRGAEVGSLEAKVELLGHVTVREVMRRSNTEIARRIAEGTGRVYAIHPIDETWMEIVIEPAQRVSGSGSRRTLRALD